MRTDNDLITVKVYTERVLSFDRERLEIDAVWNHILELHGGDVGPAIAEYVQLYSTNDKFPYQTPGTNGPGESQITGLEMIWPSS